ncbi:uncharacterized protein LOC117215651 [Bombus bifarius]|uniref:Uncharacterized protein LOC117215651 n=1 Tax=Bombus bifarius TaxID=103933 RepID=A0A6P8MVK1_9HYME|nr:uncharacterized protein LOC117161033 [Bombus vancouverensis nearcticus]XP_033317926.1 uncharacterized protein LOC117215651 [Bombus bifarius]
MTMKSRRKVRRAWMRGTNDAARLTEEFKGNRKKLARMIKDSKERCRKEFCAMLDRDSLGRPYRAIMSRVARRTRTEGHHVDRACDILLRALALKRRYARWRVWHSGEDLTEQTAPNDLGTAEVDAWDQWRSQLINKGGEDRGVEAVLPNWETWRSRRGLPLIYQMTQMLTGHGVFGEYLRKIGRETADICHHCREGRDTAQHTLELSPA